MKAKWVLDLQFTNQRSRIWQRFTFLTGYQYYEFNYIKDLAGPSKLSIEQNKTSKESIKSAATFPDGVKDSDLVNLSETNEKENNEDQGSMHNLLNLDSSEPVPSLDDDDEVLLNIDNELGNRINHGMFRNVSKREG